LKRTSDALRELERAAALEPSNARFVYAYGVALHSTGNLNAAKTTLEKALALHPDDMDVRAALANITKERQP
jgi:Flp pilus assembly protein TadD